MQKEWVFISGDGIMYELDQAKIWQLHKVSSKYGKHRTSFDDLGKMTRSYVKYHKYDKCIKAMRYDSPKINRVVIHIGHELDKLTETIPLRDRTYQEFLFMMRYFRV